MSELVDLSKLTPPNVLEELDFETLLAERKAKFISLYPEEWQDYWQQMLALESEPVVKLLEENCYLQLLERQRINNAAKATMLAYATGSDLDILAANFNVQRLVLREADYQANPPIPDVADVSVTSPQPAYVTVTLLSRQGKGNASAAVIAQVQMALNDENVRPIADRVTVESAQIVDYQIQANLHIYRGPEYEPIQAAARANLDKYVQARRRLGRDITLSGIYAALHIEGVQRVELLKPSADIILSNNQAGYCTNIQLSLVSANDY